MCLRGPSHLFLNNLILNIVLPLSFKILRRIFLNIFLYFFLCKKINPHCGPTLSMGIMKWIKLNLHCLRMLLRFFLFWLNGFREEGFQKILYNCLYVKINNNPQLWSHPIRIPSGLDLIKRKYKPPKDAYIQISAFFFSQKVLEKIFKDFSLFIPI